MSNLDEENNILIDTVREFCEKNIDEKKIEEEKIGNNMNSLLASQGFLGAKIGDKYGGSALDDTSYHIILEEISKYSPSIAMKIFMINSLYMPAVINTEHESILSDVSSGKVNVSVDFMNDKYSLDYNSNVSGIIKNILNPDSKNIVLFDKKTIIAESPFKITEKDFMGFKGLKFGDIELDNKYNVVDDKNRKEDIILNSYNDLSAIALGIISGAINKAMEYSKVRTTFGAYLKNYEPLAFKLSEMHSKENILRSILYNNLDKYYTFNFAMDSIVEIARFSVNIHGGYGYFKDFGVEKFYRDAVILKSIFYGNDQLRQLSNHVYSEKLNFI